jgi:adenylate cyclase class 2
MKSKHEEVEVRFLEINKEALQLKLKKLGAEDLGECLLREMIFYDQALTWKMGHKRVRIREVKGKILVTFKDNEILDSSRVKEIEFESSDWESTWLFLEAVGLTAARKQEKKRHSFVWNDILVDIDTWPGVPPYVELESDHEDKLKRMAGLLDLDWSKAVFRGAGYVLQHYYNIPIFDLREFTFDKVV